MKRWTIVLVLGLAAFIFISCQVAEPTEEEVTQVYAAVIRQIYTEDDTHGGSFRTPRLYVVGTTDDRAGLPSAEEGASTKIARTVPADRPTSWRR